MMKEQIPAGEQKIPLAKPPPVYSPLFWPILNILEVSRQPNEVKVRPPKSLATLGFIDHSFALVSSFRSFLLAYIIINWFYDDNHPYPAWGRGKHSTIECKHSYTISYALFELLLILVRN